jgi:predicted nucleotidyltransferase
MGIDEVLAAKRDDILRLAARHGARRLRVFGSVARGEAREDSDVDLLVVMEEGRTLLDLIALGQDLEEVLGRPVQVVSERALSPYIRDRVLTEAVAI